MTFLQTIKRAAAGLAALTAFAVAPAFAEEGITTLDKNKLFTPPPEVLEKLVTPDKPVAPKGRDFFTKTGEQLSCDYIRYDIRFGVEGDPGFLADPSIQDFLASIALDFSDQVPPGTHVVSADLSGDVTGPGGPAVQIVDVADTADTVEIKDFHISAADLDGQGGPDRREMRLVITAKIDRAAFPAPTETINQAGITARLGGVENILVSHDPALPDDGTIQTGEKTKVVIDLTGCDETPPGGTPPEPCFQLVQGEVLCDPDGLGDFIYKMPVGPEMAGQTVQLVSSTPGIVITPSEQIVPDGGGVLEWTITGASPGDAIDLMVTGVQQASGPVEGVGVCCTQRITIVIPPDLDCPEPGEPDIKVVKVANESFCTPGGPCDFTIRVSNAGTAPYNGPIALEDVTGPGNATLIAGPNAPWTCLPGVSPIMCTHPATTLNPGEFVDLKLGFQPGPGWNADFIRNCAEYDYTASGFGEPFGLQANDRSCASIPLCRRGDPRCPDPQQPKADLLIKKVPRSEYCSPAGLCGFLVGIRNVGATPYAGPLSFRDQVTAPAPASMVFAPTPPWSCSVINPSTYQCDHPGVALAPGGYLIVAVNVIAPNYPKDTLENCVDLKQVPNETNLANNKSCAKIKVRRSQQGNPDLSIAKECREPNRAENLAVANVICRISVTNNGTAAPAGDVQVSDAATMIGGGAPVQILAVQPDGPQWTCSGLPSDTLQCALPGAQLPPGAERHFDVAVAQTNGEPARNCAKGAAGQGNAFVPFGEACDTFGGSLRVQKTGDLTCEEGKTCTFEITVSNGFGVPVTDKVHIIDFMTINGQPASVPIASIDPPFGCAPEPSSLPIDCQADVTLAPGESRVHTVTIELPDNAVSGDAVEGRNCIVMGVGNQNGIAEIAPKMMAVAPSQLPPNASCHLVQVVKSQVKSCTPPLVANADGNCVCPENTRFQNGTCVPIGGKPKCDIPGQIVVGDKCQCPEGQKVINGACRVPQKDPVCTIKGQIVVGGECVCPKGTKPINGACRVPQKDPVCTIKGQIVVGGECVCPKGTKPINGACRVPQPQCDIKGQIVVDGHCVCPKGTRPINGACRVPQPQCTIKGQIVVGGECVCPKGTKPINGACRVPQPQCTIKGQIVVGGECVCPKGTRPINGACRVPQPQCDIRGQIVVGGECVCPKGTRPIDGACRVPPPKCTIKGQIVVDGNCVCPKGTRPINGACRNPLLEIAPKVLEQLQQPRQTPKLDEQTPLKRKLIIE